MRLVPVDLATARRFVGEKHRHNLPPQGWKWGVGLEVDGELVGVAMAGRPVGRHQDDGVTLEVIRTCTDGTKNANSMLYGAIARASKALGYRRLITYTLAEESGVSLRAAGFTVDGELPASGGWSSPSRPRIEFDLFGEARTPMGPKVRWVKNLAAQEKVA
jgi:hypothetical protein